MLLFPVAFAIAETVLVALTLTQYMWLLMARERNRFIHDFGQSLSTWVSDVAQFQTCATDAKPFPWTGWPSTDGDINQSDAFTGQADI